MVRSVVLFGLLALMLASPGEAGQASAGFTVGVTINGAGKSAMRLKKRKVQTEPAGVVWTEGAAPLRKTYTWRAAAISVWRAGYFYPEYGHRMGEIYWFTAYRAGTIYHVAVSVRTGQVLKVISA